MKRISFHFFYTLLLLSFISKQAFSQVSLTSGNLIYQQNFDTYTGLSIASVPQWATDGSFTFRGMGNGSSNTGGAWSYGVNGGADRALGYLGSGTSSSIGYSVSFVNNTGNPITQLRISYDFEQWRWESGNTLGWTVAGTGALAATSLAGLNTNSANGGGSGNPQVTPKLILLTGLNIAPNATFGVRWSCGNGAGNDNGIAIDNFRLEVVCTPKFVNVDTVMCANGNFLLNGTFYNTPQTINDTLTTVAGCDSVRSYHLSFLPAITHSFADTICAAGTYNWASQSYTSNGSYSHTFTSYTHCDSVVTLNLFVRPAISHSFADTMCAGDSYSWASQNLTGSGSYNHTFTSVTNCDSVVTLNLFMRPAITHSFADTICGGGTYNWASQNYTSTGAYNHTFTAATSCDSVVTLNLFVRPLITHSFADTICAAGTYNWASQNYTSTGAYNHTFTAATNCDSVVTLNLFVRPAITHSFADTICAAGTYNWASQNLTTTGVYNHTFTAATNCDSVVTLHLFVRPAIAHSFADTICAAGTYNWASQNLTTGGVYNHTFTAVTNCDSVVTLHLFVRPAISHSFADTICAAGTYNWASQSLTTSGVYNHTFTAVTNCDSIVTLNLFVRPAITHSFADTICAAATYNWASQSFTTSGVYNHTFTAVTNCDSVVTLNLFVRPAITHSFADTICAAGTYNWASQSFTISGAYNHTFTAATNCDSVVTLNLFVRPAITHSFADTICAAATYNWASQSFTTSGTYNHTFTAATNCDSVVTLNLFVRPAITHSFADTICAAGTYNWASQSFTTSGVYNHTFTAATNCDSVVTLNLFVRPGDSVTVNQTICSNTTYPFGGQSLNTTGVYNASFTDVHGCDSNVTLILQVNSVITNTIASSICYGSTLNWGSQLLSASGVYTQTFSAASACDSIVTFNLTVNPMITDTLDTAICYGNTLVLGPQVLNASGTYSQVFPAANGCDSLQVLHLTVRPLLSDTVAVSICYGQTYQNHTTTGYYISTFTSINGCDSFVTTDLKVSPQPVTVTIDTASCGMVWFEGVAYTASTTLTDTFHAVQGCDSVYRFVNINTHSNNPVVNVTDTAGCNVVVFKDITYTESTTLTDTIINIFGCDSVVNVTNIIVNHSTSQTIVHEMCAGDQLRFYGDLYTEAGAYPVMFKTQTGCDSLVTLELTVNPLPAIEIKTEANDNYCVGDSLLLQASGAQAYVWIYHDVDTVQNQDYLRTSIFNYKNSFTITGVDDKGCINTASANIEAHPCCNIFMPNAFSPNGDGNNDEFKPVTLGHPNDYVMRIFNRWGQSVFISYNVEKGWDGNIDGKPAEIADYVYRIGGKCVNGEIINLKGNCTLVR